MSSIPKIDKSKYNKNALYEWVDSQWEKFMTEQKEHKAIIKQLQDDLGTCTENFQTQRKQMEDLVSRVPSTYLTDSAEFSGETHPDAKHKSWDEIEKQEYIYERNPDTGQVYRRKFNDYDTPREQLDNDGNPLTTQTELF